VQLTVNGEALELPAGFSVAMLVGRLTPAVRGVAVAVNGEVVPRSTWQTASLTDGDRVEVLTAAQGG
jgi:sulfur carrier protein